MTICFMTTMITSRHIIIITAARRLLRLHTTIIITIMMVITGPTMVPDRDPDPVDIMAPIMTDLADITDTRASVPVDTAVLAAPDPDLVLAVIRECALADMAVPTAADPDLVPGRLQADIPVVDVMTDPAHITAADPDRQEVVTVAITVSAAVLVAVAEPSRVPVVTDMLQA